MCMRIEIRTRVKSDINVVFAGFNRELFEALTPPLMRVAVLRFDGCQKGDVVELELRIFGLIRQRWRSDIVEDGCGDREIYFIDASERENLPFFLRKWRHEHRIIADESGVGAWIVDRISYRAPFGLNWLLWPVLWLQFWYRKGVYRSFFGQL